MIKLPRSLATKVLGMLSVPLLLVLALPPAVAGAPGEELTPPSEPAGVEVKEVRQVTLVTGDKVTAISTTDGRTSFSIYPADPGRTGQNFLTIEQKGDTYIIPNGIDLGKADLELFNVSYLLREGYVELAALPLLVTYQPGLTASAVRSLEGKVAALSQETALFGEVSTIATRVAYSNVSQAYQELVSQPEVKKIWLDRKVRAELIDSVPLIGAPAWWEAGYSGNGTKIAILDTGIDSTHPALDDLDDNPATVDPKVIVNVNFTDDATFSDLYGHGTHVAGIAAGTGNLTALRNLLQNPGFENQLTSWNVSQGTATYSTDNVVFRNGAFSAKGVEINAGSLGRLYQNVTGLVSPGRTYRISGSIKTQNATGAVVIGLNYVDANGWTPAGGYVTEIGRVSGTADWKYFESNWFVLPVMPSGAVGAWFLFDFNGGTGTAWFDDVSLYELPDRIPGVAPAARLWNVKVLNRYGGGYWSWIINGINFASLGPDGVARTGDEADVISMSLGGSAGEGPDPVSDAVNLAVDRGVTVVVAAGNSGYNGLFTVSTPGVAEKAITVGASAKNDTLAPFSSRGPTLDLRVKPDILAPGVSINSAVPGGGYKSMSGTSMATPHVAGAAALFLQATRVNGMPAGMTAPQFIKDTLMSSAKDLGLSVYEQGAGRLDLDRGFRSLQEDFEDGVADGWRVHWGAWAVETDTQKDGTTGKVYSADTTTSNTVLFSRPFPRDLSFSADVRLVATLPHHNRTVVLTLPDESVMWVFGYRGDTNELLISKGGVGVFTGVTKPISASEALKTSWDRLTLEVSGSTLKGYRNGVLELEWSDPQLLATSEVLVGFQSGGAHSHFDNVRVTAQGGQLWPVVGVSPASTSLGIFGSGDTIASGNLTFFNSDNLSHQVTLSANLTDVILGESYSASVSLNASSFALPAGSHRDVQFTVDIASLPTSLYSGKILANVDNVTQVRAIFGFAKVRVVTVLKTDISGTPARGHPVWVYMERPLNGVFGLEQTDDSGNITMYAIDGVYNLISPNWWVPPTEPTTIWTIAENVTVSGDMVISLDERDTAVVDFNANRPGLIPATKVSTIYYGSNPWGVSAWKSSWYYPRSFVTRVSPTRRFDTAFAYNAYPEADFMKFGPGLVNTGEWWNLPYYADNITGNTTFVADYPNLVHRFTRYGVALKGQRAYWSQYVWSPLDPWTTGFGYQMDAPQVRAEWLSPQPVEYGTYLGFSRESPDRKTDSWSFSGWNRYPPGKFSYGIGIHPLASGAYSSVSWNVPLQPVLPPQPVVPPPGSIAAAADTVNRLNIKGPISRDASGNTFVNSGAPFSGHLKVTMNSDNVVLERDIPDYFDAGVYFTGTANITVEIGAWTPMALSPNNYTRLHIVADPTRDSRPPWIVSQVPRISPFGVAHAGNITVVVFAYDESALDSVQLFYSLRPFSENVSGNFTDAGAPTFVSGAYVFDLGYLQDTFVNLTVVATDMYGNSIQRSDKNAFAVGAPAVQVSVKAPRSVVPGGRFRAAIGVNTVESFDAANYDIVFNPAVLSVDNVTGGHIGMSGNMTEIPVDYWTVIAPGRVRVVQNVPSLDGVSGSGNLAMVSLRAIGPFGASSNITLENGMLSDTRAESIPAQWVGTSVILTGRAGDATADGALDARDVTKVERIIAHLDPPTPEADANGDGAIDAMDITKVERLIVGLDAPPVGQPSYGGVLNLAWSAPLMYFDEASYPAVSLSSTLPFTNEELLTGNWAKGPAGTNEATWLYNKFPTPQTLAGALAESWEISANSTLVFHLRKGVAFQDKEPRGTWTGRAINAGDVVLSLTRLWQTSTSYHYRALPWQDYFETLDGGPWIRAVDTFTVEVKAKPGKLPKVFETAGDLAKVVPSDVVQEFGNMNDWRNSVGTGAFMLTDYTVNSTATLVRNPNYWMKDPLRPGNQLPYLDGVRVHIIPDYATRLAALRTGKIDRLEALSGPDAASVRASNPELRFLRYLPAWTTAVFMRTDNVTMPYRDIRVRKALALAVDRQAIRTNYYGGDAEILTSPITPVLDFMDMYTPLDQLPLSARELFGYNPEKAKQLLAEAGYPNGFKTQVVGISSQVDLLSIVKSYWAAIGVDLTIDIRETAGWVAVGRAKNYTDMYASTVATYRAFDFLYWRPGNASNYSMINDTNLNDRISQIDAAYFNEAYRRTLLKERAPYMLEQAWMLELPQPYFYTFWQPWVKGYHGESWVGMMNPYYANYVWLAPR